MHRLPAIASPSHLVLQASSSTSEAVEALSPKENNGVVSDLFSAKSTVSGDCKVAINGKHDEEPKMTPEELAFMRSLGWEENTDDAAGRKSYF